MKILIQIIISFIFTGLASLALVGLIGLDKLGLISEEVICLWIVSGVFK